MVHSSQGSVSIGYFPLTCSIKIHIETDLGVKSKSPKVCTLFFTSQQPILDVTITKTLVDLQISPSRGKSLNTLTQDSRTGLAYLAKIVSVTLARESRQRDMHISSIWGI